MSAKIRCLPTNLHLEMAGKVRNRYLARIPIEVEIEDVLDPDFFGELMRKPKAGANGELTEGDIIECEAENFAYHFELQVRAQIPSTTQCVTMLRGEISVAPEPELPKGYDIEWIGGAEHYALTYEGKPVETGFVTKEGAAIRCYGLRIQDEQQLAARDAAQKVSSSKTPRRKPAQKKATADA